MSLKRSTYKIRNASTSWNAQNAYAKSSTFEKQGWRKHRYKRRTSQRVLRRNPFLAQGNAERPGSCVSIKEQIWRRPGTARWGIADYSTRKVCMGSSLAARAAASHTAASATIGMRAHQPDYRADAGHERGHAVGNLRLRRDHERARIAVKPRRGRRPVTRPDDIHISGCRMFVLR
jgi:hypothetical protein